MVVRMRATRSHRQNRRAHHALKSPAISKDPKTGTINIRHRASAVTGVYRGHSVIDLAKRIARKEKKMKAAGTQA
ncbi:MAG TPA: 50S ribosomal protein L32 [Candidatus Paceibacterota bacterium]|nr:50S ribosomal protein L32 [Candidatus Paceibacterota bacterium]